MKKLYALVSLFIAITFSVNSQTKYVVIEEHTGGWCQWCPGGTYFVDSLIQTYSNVIAIAGHSSDPMEYPDYMSGLSLSSAPSAHTDRGGQASSIGNWFSDVNAAMNQTPVASIEVFQSFNSSNRELTVRVKATFTSTISGTYKLGGMITEDAIHGTSADYTQSNAYGANSNGPMGGYETLPKSIPGSMICYNHVARHMLGGFNGQANSVPSNIQIGDTASYTFTYTLPTDWDEEYIKSVGFLFDANNTIDNAGKSNYLDGTHNAAPVFLSSPITDGFVNSFYSFNAFASDPDDKNLTITANVIPSWLSISGVSSLGFIHTKAILEGIPTATGTFPVELVVSDGSKSTTLNFDIVIAPELPGNWTLIGSQGFTNADFIIDIASDKNGTLYALINNSISTQVYEKNGNSSWVQMGNLGTSDYFGGIRIGSDGLTPYVAIGSGNGISVKKFKSGDWISIGSSFIGGVQIGFDLDANDQPYVAFQDGSSGYAGSCYTYENNTWVRLGNTTYSNGSPAVWNDLRVDKTSGNVYALWTDFNGGRVPMVSIWDGSNWSILGGSAITNSQVAFDQSIDINPVNNHIMVSFVKGGGSSGTLEAYEYDDNSWVQIGSDVTNGTVAEIDMVMNKQGVMLISFQDKGFSDATSTMSYSYGNWSFVGPRAFSGGSISQTAITTYDNMPYVLYKDNSISGKATVKYYDSPVVSVIENNTISSAINVFPNPGNSYIQVEGLKKIHFGKIFSIQGAMIWSGYIDQNGVISTARFDNGIYILQIEHVKQKIIIQH
jgi:hypothetical protein